MSLGCSSLFSISSILQRDGAGGLRAPGGLQRRVQVTGVAAGGWQPGWVLMPEGDFSLSHTILSQTQICQEPPRCPKEEKGPGFILLLEDIKNEQTGRERGGMRWPSRAPRSYRTSDVWQLSWVAQSQPRPHYRMAAW